MQDAREMIAHTSAVATGYGRQSMVKQEAGAIA